MGSWVFNNHLLFALQQDTPDQERFFRWYLSYVPGWGLPGRWAIHVLLDPRDKAYAAYVVTEHEGHYVAIQHGKMSDKALDELAFQSLNEKFQNVSCRPLWGDGTFDAGTETIQMKGPLWKAELVCSGMKVFRTGIIKLEPYDGPDPYIPFRTKLQFVAKDAQKHVEAWKKNPEMCNWWQVEEFKTPTI